MGASGGHRCGPSPPLALTRSARVLSRPLAVVALAAVAVLAVPGRAGNAGGPTGGRPAHPTTLPLARSGRGPPGLDPRCDRVAFAACRRSCPAVAAAAGDGVCAASLGVACGLAAGASVTTRRSALPGPSPGGRDGADVDLSRCSAPDREPGAGAMAAGRPFARRSCRGRAVSVGRDGATTVVAGGKSDMAGGSACPSGAMSCGMRTRTGQPSRVRLSSNCGAWRRTSSSQWAGGPPAAPTGVAPGMSSSISAGVSSCVWARIPRGRARSAGSTSADASRRLAQCDSRRASQRFNGSAITSRHAPAIPSPV